LLRPSPRRRDVASYVSFVKDFQASTRKYAKRQMQWYRKCPNVLFVEAGAGAAEEIANHVQVGREEFERRLREGEGKSEMLKKTNEGQGPGMKHLISNTVHDLGWKDGTGDFSEEKSLEEADYWTSQVQNLKW
jgi:hypothetical protein